MYLTTEISYQQLALKLKINNPSLIANWVRAFHGEGIERLSKPKGRPAKMKNKNTNQLGKNNSIKSTDKNSKRIKELENQVLSLKIQNAFLKELRSLQTEENQTNKLQKSSTDSEKSSN